MYIMSTCDQIQIEKHTNTESKGMEKNISCKRKQKKLAQQYLDKINFKTKAIREKEQCYIMIRRSIQQENIILVNIYVFNIRAPKYIK